MLQLHDSLMPARAGDRPREPVRGPGGWLAHFQHQNSLLRRRGLRFQLLIQ